MPTKLPVMKPRLEKIGRFKLDAGLVITALSIVGVTAKTTAYALLSCSPAHPNLLQKDDIVTLEADGPTFLNDEDISEADEVKMLLETEDVDDADDANDANDANDAGEANLSLSLEVNDANILGFTPRDMITAAHFDAEIKAYRLKNNMRPNQLGSFKHIAVTVGLQGPGAEKHCLFFPPAQTNKIATLVPHFIGNDGLLHTVTLSGSLWQSSAQPTYQFALHEK
ncbi:hypothetical protein HWV62_16706 [Athelia sp. TMB]|nr:hypothetical protein HWV62_16706 [Athelia sp. TMB]